MARSWSVRVVCSLLFVSCFFAFFAAAAKALDAEIDDRYNLVRRQGTGSLPNATSSTPVDTATETDTATITETDVTTTTVTPTPTTDASTPSASSDSSSDAETSSDTPSTPPHSTVTTTSTTRRTTRTSATETTTAEPSTSTFIGTTTDERGAPSTFTSIVIVRPTHTPSGTSTGTPGLQSDVAAPMMRKELFAVLGGAFAVAMLL